MSKPTRKTGSFRRRILPGALRRLKRIGICIEPFLTVREGEKTVDVPEPPADFEFGFLTEADVDDLVYLEPGVDRQDLLNWLQEGKLCYGVKDQSRLIAKMWCDLDAFNYPPNFRKLAEDEAYLYAAYSDPEYRGHGLAPIMRARGYAALREMGRDRFYSYTEFLNYAARGFKAKLGARDEALKLHLGLFKKWSTTLTLRRYL